MADIGYLRALETRIGWLRWLHSEQAAKAMDLWLRHSGQGDAEAIAGMEACQKALANGATYYMAGSFCQMVNQLREAIPDDLELDSTWLLTHDGFVLFEKPFLNSITPEMAAQSDAENTWPQFPEVAALGWTTPSDDIPVFIAFADVTQRGVGRYGFLPISIYSIPFHTPIQKLVDVRANHLRQLYQNHPEEIARMMTTRKDCLHLTYTILYLMAQKLAAEIPAPASRAQRRRLEPEQVPLEPLIKIITLRRLEQQTKEGKSHPVQWSCQWLVRWHWRNQYCPSTGEHRWIAIDTYVKGPSDKPLKSPAAQIFVASR